MRASIPRLTREGASFFVFLKYFRGSIEMEKGGGNVDIIKLGRCVQSDNRGERGGNLALFISVDSKFAFHRSGAMKQRVSCMVGVTNAIKVSRYQGIHGYGVVTPTW